MADTPDLASEPEEQNRRGFFDGFDPVEPVLHYLGSSSSSGCTAATKSVQAAIRDGTDSAAGEAAGSVADAAATSVVEAAGDVAKAIVGGILDGV